MSRLSDTFLREKQFLDGVSPHTLKFLRLSLSKLAAHLEGDELPTSETVLQCVIGLRESGLKTGAVNAYVRGINSYLGWLHAKGHIAQRVRAPLQKQPKRVLRTYGDREVLALLDFKPTTRGEKRVKAAIALMCDTGARIGEILGIEREDVLLESYALTLRKTKGGKERTVPLSREGAKAIFHQMESHPHRLVFCTRDGLPIGYRNFVRDFFVVLDRLGIEKTEGIFHAFRRYFAKSYLRSGGNVLYLQAILGHADLETTRKYVDTELEILQERHLTASPIEALRRGRR